MPVIPSDKRLREMIDLAMQDRAPQMYARLKREDLLEQEISDRAAAAREANSVALGKLLTPILEDPALPDLVKQAARVNRAAQSAWEQALAVAIEFPEENEESAAHQAA